jgi:hypothetical protein
MDGIDHVHGGDVSGGGLRIVQATAEEQAAITQFLKERGAAAPSAAPGTSALMSAGLRLAGVLFVVAGMGGGLGDLVHLHDSGGGPAHHAAVRREEESRGQRLKGGKAETLPSEVAKTSRAKESGKGTTDHGLQDYGGKAFPIKLLKQVLDSTVELQAAIEQIFKGQPLPDKDLEGSISPPKRPEMNAEGRMQNAESEGGAAYVFRWTGRDWKVVFGGGEPFYLEDTLGGRYVNYLVHHPNVPISAFELEVAVQPEKGKARSRNSIQPQSDPRARREYGQALRRLQAEREEARTAGGLEEVARLEGQIEALEAALKGGGAADTGERARVNVRKTVVVVLGQLRKGGPEEKALAEHLQVSVLTIDTSGTCW